MTHELKTWKEYFEEVWKGNKPYEIRYNDRNFQKGDKVILVEVCKDTMVKTGRYIVAYIGYVFNPNESDISAIGSCYCVFGLKKAKKYSSFRGEYFEGSINF